MRLIAALIGTLVLVGCGTPSESTSALEDRASSRRVVQDYDDLKTLLGAMSESAQGGPSLMHFSYKERFWMESLDGCDTVSARTVKRWFKGYASDIFESGEGANDETDELLRAASGDVSSYFGRSKYYHCAHTENEFMALAFVHTLISKDGKVRIQLKDVVED